MESREQIANHIKQYKTQDVKLLYELMVRSVSKEKNIHAFNSGLCKGSCKPLRRDTYYRTADSNT